MPVPRSRCYRCRYIWVPRRSPVRRCSRCKSTLWSTPKIHSFRLGNGLGIEEVIAPHRKEILALARKYGVRELRVFGSVRRREARPDSDVDFLVTWKRNRPPMAWLRLPIEMRRLLGRPVDLGEAEARAWSVRPQVEAEAVPV